MDKLLECLEHLSLSDICRINNLLLGDLSREALIIKMLIGEYP